MHEVHNNTAVVSTWHGYPRKHQASAPSTSPLSALQWHLHTARKHDVTQPNPIMKSPAQHVPSSSSTSSSCASSSTEARHVWPQSAAWHGTADQQDDSMHEVHNNNTAVVSTWHEQPSKHQASAPSTSLVSALQWHLLPGRKHDVTQPNPSMKSPAQHVS